MHIHIPHRSHARAPARERGTSAIDSHPVTLSPSTAADVHDSINEALEDCYKHTATYHPHSAHRYTSPAGYTVLIARCSVSAGYATIAQYHGVHGGWYCFVGRAQSDLFPMHPP
jgi:hypothetical protein